MKLAWFGVEEWLNPMDSLARINLGSSCVSALRMDELFDLTGEDLDAFLNEMRTMSLHYHHGDATGSPRIKAAVAGIYPKGNVKPEEVMITHGGTGANDLVLMSVLEPGDNCVVIKPSYQQHYDIPKGSGIETRVVQLKAEDNYQLDFDALDKACDANTKMIVLTNPNNPIGVTLYDEGLRKVVDIAAKHDAWILCDEVYRGLDENYMPSILDYGYHKAISISSMSKMYSMAGTRIGWDRLPRPRDVRGHEDPPFLQHHLLRHLGRDHRLHRAGALPGPVGPRPFHSGAQPQDRGGLGGLPAPPAPARQGHGHHLPDRL